MEDLLSTLIWVVFFVIFVVVRIARLAKNRPGAQPPKAAQKPPASSRPLSTVRQTSGQVSRSAVKPKQPAPPGRGLMETVRKSLGDLVENLEEAAENDLPTDNLPKRRLEAATAAPRADKTGRTATPRMQAGARSVAAMQTTLEKQQARLSSIDTLSARKGPLIVDERDSQVKRKPVETEAHWHTDADEIRSHKPVELSAVDLRSKMVWAEILGRPVAMRE